MSALMAARLAERMPKFTPPKPGEPVTSPVVTDAKAAEPDPAATDRPRNTIVRLPNYVVQEEKPEAFKERNLLTGWGRLQLAYKRHPGLHIGSLPILSNDGIGLFMLEEEDRLERKAEMEELVTVITTPAERAKAKAALHDTFIRKE
jgi:hypothetical protein